MKKKYIIIAAILLVSAFISPLLIKKEEKIEENNVVENIKKEEIEKVKEEVNAINCYVDIKGAVFNPNVYECKSDDRIIDIINLAGGLRDDADTSLINLSKKIEDQMTIIIYTKKQVNDAKERLNQPKVIEIIKEIEKECKCLDDINDGCINENIEETNKNKENNNTSKVNINTASKEQLMTLPGIGESKANQIINYRNNTPFKNIEDLKNVTGIGDSTFDNLKDYITV
jgi:competence protein ComEA